MRMYARVRPRKRKEGDSHLSLGITAMQVLMICVGTSIASAGEAHFNLIGLIIMLCAEICEATRLVLTQKLLNNLKFPAMEVQMGLMSHPEDPLGSC